MGAATFLDYSSTPIPQYMDSMSIKPFLNGTWDDQAHGYKEIIHSGLAKMRLVIKQINESVTWKLICCDSKCVKPRYQTNYYDGKSELLYNVKTDLYERNNVAKEYPDVVDELRKLLPGKFCKR